MNLLALGLALLAAAGWLAYLVTREERNTRQALLRERTAERDKALADFAEERQHTLEGVLAEVTGTEQPILQFSYHRKTIRPFLVRELAKHFPDPWRIDSLRPQDVLRHALPPGLPAREAPLAEPRSAELHSLIRRLSELERLTETLRGEMDVVRAAAPSQTRWPGHSQSYTQFGCEAVAGTRIGDPPDRHCAPENAPRSVLTRAEHLAAMAIERRTMAARIEKLEATRTGRVGLADVLKIVREGT